MLDYSKGKEGTFGQDLVHVEVWKVGTAFQIVKRVDGGVDVWIGENGLKHWPQIKRMGYDTFFSVLLRKHQKFCEAARERAIQGNVHE